jgi:hypothetical protein
MDQYADHVDEHDLDVEPTKPIEVAYELVEPKAPPRTQGRRPRRWPLVLLVPAAAGAFVGVYFVLRPDGGEHRVASAKSSTSTTFTSVTATFSAGPPQTLPAEATTVPAPTILPGPDPRGQIKFLNGAFQCPGDGSLTVQGTVFNDGAGVYSIRFTVFILDASGAAIDSATGAVDHLAAGERRAYTAAGTCARPITGGARGRGQVDSITPG